MTLFVVVLVGKFVTVCAMLMFILSVQFSSHTTVALSEASAYVKILTECGGINQGKGTQRGGAIPRGAALRDGPEWCPRGPDTRGGIEHTLEHMSESIINTDLPAYSDTLGTREKCHCSRVSL